MKSIVVFFCLFLAAELVNADDVRIKRGETVLELFHGENNPRNSEGSFCTLKNGDIIFVYSKFYGKSYFDHAGADLALRRSSDGGKTWSNSDEIIVKNSGLNVMSVSLLRLLDGRIAMLYLQKDMVNGSLVCCPTIVFSSDEAKSWSSPQKITQIPCYLVVNNDRLIQLKSGRLVVPAAFHRYRNNTQTLDIRGIVLFYLSDDGGKTWRESREIVYPPSSKSLHGLLEPGVVELNNGCLLAWFRTTDGVQFKSFSLDRGDTWTPACRAEEFRSPDSPLSMKRNPSSGELIAVWNDQNPYWNMEKASPKVGNRTPLVLAKSYDDGITWRDHVLLESEPDHGYCYTAIHFTNNALLIAYCCGGGVSYMWQDLKIRRIELQK